MQEITTWTDLFMHSLTSFGEKFMGALPSILGVIFIFLFGYIIAKIVSFLVSKILKLAKFDSLSDKINLTEYLQKANITMMPSAVVGKFVYWILILLVFITASETLGWHAVSSEISKLISFLPKLFIAIVLFIIGTYIASIIRDIIAGATRSLGISTGKIISSFVFYLLFITICLTALSQAGVNTDIITSNLLLILGAILLSASISYGFASRDVLSHVLAGFFSNSIYRVGMIIEVDGVKGKIVNKNKIGLTIEDSLGDQVVIPSSLLINAKVKIVKS